MCGRYALISKAEKLKERFKIDVTENYKPRYNAAPTQLMPVITNTHPQGFSFFYWGLVPAWAKNKSVSAKLFNARGETLAEKASFRNALKSRRCIIPADGFYEWKRVSKKGRIPYWIFPKDRNPISFAGLWEEYEDDTNEMVHTFTIITTEPNSMMTEIHDRMPVILNAEQEKRWLDNGQSQEDLLDLMQPYNAEKLDKYTVSSKVNQVTNDFESLTQPAPPADQFGNYTLFG